jgi:hypothetical protein
MGQEGAMEQVGDMVSDSEGEDVEMVLVKSEVRGTPPLRRMVKQRSLSSSKK